MCCLRVKTLHNQWDEIKNPTLAPRRGVLEEFLAFSFIIHKKFCNWLQKVYYPVYPHKQYVIHLYQINYTEENWWLRSDHLRGTGQSALCTFSHVHSQQVLMDVKTKAQRNRLTCPSLHYLEVVEPRFELKVCLTLDGAYVLNFYVFC